MATREELSGRLKTLTSLHGAPGHESEEVGAYVQQAIAPYADRVEVDAYGNVYALREGHPSGPRLMLAAHMDEVGMVVSRIERNGFLRFKKVGFPIDGLMPARRVRVGKVVGVIGAKDFHTMSREEQRKVQGHRHLFIDIGARSAEEAREMGVQIGTPVTFLADYTTLGKDGNLIATKALDDRVGCALLLKLFQELSGEPLQGTLHGVFTVQEEVGMRGAQMAGYRVNPDAALVLEAGLTEDTPFYPGLTDDSAALGKGPILFLQEFTEASMRGMIGHPGMMDYVASCARKAEVPLQRAIMTPYGLTDATPIHLSRQGIPTCCIGVPIRYAHSPVEMLDLRDLESTLRLLLSVASNLKELQIRD